MTAPNGNGTAANRGKRIPREPTLWEEMIPWFMTAISVVVLVCLAWFLLENIYWFRTMSTASSAPTSSEYRIYVYQMHLATINRSVGLFAGFSLIFIGTAVALFTLKKYTHIEGTAAGATAKLSSASPGIIAIFLGAVLIMFTIGSKDYFPPPPGGQQVDIRPQQGEPQPQ